MKKRLLVLALLLLTGGYAFAQEGTRVGLSFGTTFNSTNTEVDGTKVDEASQNGVGIRFALDVRRGFSENYGLQTGVALVTKNFGKKSDAGGKLSLTTIELPVGMFLRTNELGSGLYVNGFLGPTLDFNVSARNKTDDQNNDAGDVIKTLGASFKFGLGAEKEFDFGTVTAGLSYNLGLTNVSDVGNNTTTKANYFAVSVGYFFN